MNKDVIYIDVEDDITAIIGKVKDSKEKIIALVPPKRIGVLQSAVNLRLLQRTAKAADKRLVLITNDRSLMPLAGGAEIPVAKNLQSKPEIPEVAALKFDDDDDIIDGAQLPVGDHAGLATGTPVRADRTAPTRSIPVDDAIPAKSPKATASATPRAAGKAAKVPNFNAFRKKLIIIVVAVCVLIGFFVWAIIFAPKATIEVTTKTSSVTVSTSAEIGTSLQTDAAKGTLRSVRVEDKQESSMEFMATGTEEKGEKATGVVTMANCADRSGVTIDAGTAVSYGNYNFITSQTVEVPGGSSSSPFGGCDRPGTANVSVVAQGIGEAYNFDAGTSFDVAGHGGIEASNSRAITGGSKKTLKIVTQADVQKASEQLAKQDDAELKAKLQKKFGDNVKAIESSFQLLKSNAEASPKVGEEAPDGKAKLTATMTHSMDGIANADLESFIEGAVKAKLSKENDQRLYDAGLSTVQLVDFAATTAGGTLQLRATAQVGPRISDEEVQTRVRGKRIGEVQTDLESIQGVDSVNVKLSPFWVSKVPNNDSKIKVEFKLINTASDGSKN